MHFSPNGGQADDDLVVVERGEGPYVFDTDGRRYLDGLSSLFCSQLGHSYGEEFAAAAAEQQTRLGFSTIWGTAHPASIELAQQIAERAPSGIEKVFFTSGGSESVEAAWKIVRQYHVANGEPQRTKAVARQTAYHGVSLGALSFTGVERIKVPFGRPAIETKHVSNTNPFRSPFHGEALTEHLLQELREAIEAEGADTVAMLIAEPVQNAGGCLTPPPGYWPGLRKICDDYGILLVADSVICGFGRLGDWFGFERYGGRPDLVTLAKGMTSARAPMGAVLVSDAVTEPITRSGSPLLHGMTFGGHPLSAAIALRNIEILEREGVLENVRNLEPYLRRGLQEHVGKIPMVADIRGAGFFWAIELTPDGGSARFSASQAEQMANVVLPRALREAGLIARADTRGDLVLHIAPPLNVGEETLDELVERVAMTLELAAR